MSIARLYKGEYKEAKSFTKVGLRRRLTAAKDTVYSKYHSSSLVNRITVIKHIIKLVEYNLSVREKREETKARAKDLAKNRTKNRVRAKRDGVPKFPWEELPEGTSPRFKSILKKADSHYLPSEGLSSTNQELIYIGNLDDSYLAELRDEALTKMSRRESIKYAQSTKLFYTFIIDLINYYFEKGRWW